MRIAYALWSGILCWWAASWIALAVEGGDHQLTLWNWLVLVGAFLVGFAASLVVTVE